MRRQLYATGQVVNVAGTSLTGPATRDDFRIVRRYQVDDRPDLYHVQSLVDPTERMVSERELTAAPANMTGLAPFHHNAVAFTASASRHAA